MVRAAGVTSRPGSRVLVVTSALRGELYAASYRFDLPHSVETLSPPSLATPETLRGECPDLLVADCPDKTVDRLGDQFAVPLVRGVASLPSAAALLRLVGVAGGAVRLLDLDEWEPSYGRPAEAQARWESAHGKTLADSTRDLG
jgi:tRNA A37 threonylcarbamoyladenosine modification protein TsaB